MGRRGQEDLDSEPRCPQLPSHPQGPTIPWDPLSFELRFPWPSVLGTPALNSPGPKGILTLVNSRKDTAPSPSSSASCTVRSAILSSCSSVTCTPTISRRTWDQWTAMRGGTGTTSTPNPCLHHPKSYYPFHNPSLSHCAPYSDLFPPYPPITPPLPRHPNPHLSLMIPHSPQQYARLLTGPQP